MWFSRPEFDRYARFKSHGSVKELFSWDDLCETLIPVPHPASKTLQATLKRPAAQQ